MLGVHADGTVRPIPAHVAVGTADPLIAEARLRHAIRSGAAAALCDQVARHAGPDVREVLVVEEVHDVVRRVEGEPSVEDRVVHATCAVPP